MDCICTPKNSKKNKKCLHCHPDRKLGKGHDPRKIAETNQHKGMPLGQVLVQVEPRPEDHSEED